LIAIILIEATYMPKDFKVYVGLVIAKDKRLALWGMKIKRSYHGEHAVRSNLGFKIFMINEAKLQNLGRHTYCVGSR
jgi:hypothetical protein